MSHLNPASMSEEERKDSPQDNTADFKRAVSACKFVKRNTPRIAKLSYIKVGGIVRSRFHNGERYYRVDIPERNSLVGRHVIYVGATDTDEALLEMFRLGCTFAELGATARTFVIPYLGYSTMERDVLPGEVVTAKTVLTMLSAIPSPGAGNMFLFLDLHAAGIRRFMSPNCVTQEAYCDQLLVKAAIELFGFDPAESVIASADLGRTTWVNSFSRRFGTGIAFIRKERSKDKTQVCEVIGNVKGRKVVIYDDMVRTGKTLVQAADAYLASGATAVYALISHCAIPTREALDSVLNSSIKHIITTNSHPSTSDPAILDSDKITVLSVAPVFAKILLNGILAQQRSL
ncbi:ribose-phosphate diphosphokinase [Kipferlia bialata]|uniref:ribose-phosphate diphosphokinase n=1 Tax=Kipferlia bialata TaxID=797122 RepID=A0A9K3CPA9_9EUKA|nr:ribose-phosphate diphosphokinase [Kipferlia bialata]|eukprot:g555.t1